MTTSGFIALMAMAFVVFFVALWLFVMWLSSWASGWRRLAERFKTTFEFDGETVSYVSARIGWGNYSAALVVGANDQGLYLVPVWAFRPFHLPLLIPWTEIEAHVRTKSAYPRVRLTFPSVPGKRIWLYGRAAKQCLPYLRMVRNPDDIAPDERAVL